MKKLTFLMLHLNYGGLERQVTTLANSLSDEYDISFVCLYDILSGKSFYKLNDNIKVKYVLPYGPNKNELVEALKNFRIVSLFKNVARTIKIIYTKFFKVRKIVNGLDADILISSRIEFSKQIKRSDITKISQEHSYIDNVKYIKKVKESFRYFDYLVVMTNAAKQKYEEWLKNTPNKPNIVVIPNVIQNNNNVSTLENKQIIAVGRLEEIKDFSSLIDVYSIVEKKHPDWNLKIVGSGKQEGMLKEKVENLNLKDKIIFTGAITHQEVKEEICDSSIFALTSKSESFSLVLAEAMSCGVPAVSFDIEVGPREIINNGIDGYLVKNRDIEEMAKKIEELINDKELRIKFGINAKVNVSRFYPDEIKIKWKNILSDIK